MDLGTFDKLLESAKLPEATVRLCLRGDLQVEWETAEAELAAAAAAAKGDKRLTGTTPEQQELAEQVRKLEQRMTDATVTFRLRGMERRKFRELVEAHPPRKDHEGDTALGINESTFWDALLTRCLVEPELDEKRVTQLIDKITDAQFKQLADTAWTVNGRAVDVPFSPTASQIAPSSGPTSRPPSGSVSPSNGSTGGSRRKSSTTTTTPTGG